jgi:hypothetical protein
MPATTDEIVIDNERYVPVKTAADFTGYTADYIGQLCRGEKIAARRLGRAWYVSVESLLSYKQSQQESEESLPEQKETKIEPIGGKREREFAQNSDEKAARRDIFKESAFVVYHKDERPLIPVLNFSLENTRGEDEIKPVLEEKEASRPDEVNTEASQKPTSLPLSGAQPLFLPMLKSLTSMIGRMALVATSFAVVFMLIFSFNGSYTKGLISDAMNSFTATAVNTKAGETIESDILNPLQVAAIRFTDTIDMILVQVFYEDAIYAELKSK